MTQVQLRHAISLDFVAIVALERATEFAPHWSPATYAGIVNSTTQKRHLIVAYRDQELVGFAVAAFNAADQLAELESVVVTAHARRLGIGRALCAAVLDWSRAQGATEVILEVRATSAGAITLYAALGFKQIGRRPRYYRDPEDDALAMRLQL